jgi:hypothetical protein
MAITCRAHALFFGQSGIQRLSMTALIVTAAIPVLAQQAEAPVAAKPDIGSAAAMSPEAAEVLAFEARMEAATVRGDVAYVDKVTAPDLSFTHGDAWTSGGKPLSIDNKAGYLKRVENKQYIARDFDSVKVELHGNVAITYAGLRETKRRVAVRVAPDGSWANLRPDPRIRKRQVDRR